MSKTKFKYDDNLVLVNTSASLANLKAQIAPQKISDLDGSAQDSNTKTRNENSTYNLVYGKRFHQTLLAENLHGALHLYDYLDSSFFPKLNDPIFRLSKLFFTNYLLVDYMLTMNHELGHGYRMIEAGGSIIGITYNMPCLLYTSPSPRDLSTSRMPSSA